MLSTHNITKVSAKVDFVTTGNVFRRWRRSESLIDRTARGTLYNPRNAPTPPCGGVRTVRMSVHYPPLHPTDASFADIRERDGLYVDKTHHFRNLLATDPQPRGGPPALTTRHQFLVRPRRFGKTLLINTLEAWFQGLPPDLSERLDPHAPTFTGRREGWSSPDWLWEGLDAADWHGAHGWHPVVRLDMSRRTPDNPADMQRCLQRQMMHLVNLWVHRGVPREHFWDPPLPDDTPGDILTSLLEALGSCYRAPPVVLVDEYDAPVTHYLGRDVDAAPALDALRELYRVLKDDAGLLYGVLVTGITRLAKPYLFSAANNFKDISSISTYADLCGFTENEVDRDLAPYRAALREKEPAFDETTMLAQWREMYNGYRFSRRPDTKRVYNPYTLTYGLDLTLSDVETREHALQGKWPSAWSETAHPALAVRLAADTRQTLPVGVREGAPTPLPSGHLDNLQRPDFVRLMQDTGYYTWHGGADGTEPYLDFPNREVATSWLRNIMDLWAEYDRPNAAVLLDDVRQHLYAGDVDAFARTLESFYRSLAYQNLDSEACFRAVLQTLCFQVTDNVQAEKSTWGGRSDLEVGVGNHIHVMEVKRGGSAAEALLQIRDRPYGSEHLPGNRQALAVGLAFRKDKQHGVRLECRHRDLRDLLRERAVDADAPRTSEPSAMQETKEPPVRPPPGL